MEIEIFQVDAFAETVFTGNPAAVCPLQEWLPDQVMQNIALENNLSETAFYIPQGDDFHIRWFTPAFEVDLCGHATLATAFIIFHYKNYSKNTITFNSKSGLLSVEKKGEALTMNFPVDQIKEITPPPHLEKALKIEIEACFKGKDDYLVIIKDEESLAKLSPDFALLSTIDARGVIVSALGEEVDFVSRGFFPRAGINEDPVTGSAHTTLMPYWSKRLNNNTLVARQISQRGGQLFCQLEGTRVHITGNAVAYLSGTIQI